MSEREDAQVDVATLAELLHETADHHDSFEKAAPPHDWWDWYAPYLDARMRGATSEDAVQAADRYMKDVRGVVRGQAEAMPAESNERGVRVPPRQLDRILVAVDGSPASGHATTFAVDLAADHGATLLFVHVVRAFELDASDEEDLVAIPRQPSERDRVVLDDAAAAAADRGVRAETALIPGRATAEEIVAHGKANDVDMIIVGSSGHGAVRSTLLGNVPLGVLRRSTRPVLIVRGDIPFHAEPT